MKLAFSIPGFPNIDPPPGVPGGSLFPVGQNIIGVIIVFFAVFAVFFAGYQIIRSALNMITSGGDKERFAHARERLRYAIIGLLVIFFSFFIINLFSALFGAPLIGTGTYTTPPLIPTPFATPTLTPCEKAGGQCIMGDPIDPNPCDDLGRQISLLNCSSVGEVCCVSSAATPTPTPTPTIFPCVNVPGILFSCMPSCSGPWISSAHNPNTTCAPSKTCCYSFPPTLTPTLIPLSTPTPIKTPTPTPKECFGEGVKCQKSSECCTNYCDIGGSNRCKTAPTPTPFCAVPPCIE